MKFLNTKQNKNFWKIKEQIPAELKGDRELLSVAYIMASSEELNKKMAPYINWVDGFDYEKMFANETFSPSEKTLAKVAVSLYDNGVNLQFVEVFSELDQSQKEVALLAANYRYDKKDIYEPTNGNLYIN
ncbi:hypothetical protein [Heyndrickxia sporothermodurans]|uniref:hypothetical protein n=1 Tax=Heyndrickxia sporothermodurans TaxID=46224 RepID=UPI000D38E783|nr:hypothetical protein [Heyndrickxia sporothermodurans]PTY89748.1 hypothetical protein B5V90_07465 [Heyndrickxia sporothermodurans]